MGNITIPEGLLRSVDTAAAALGRSREEIICQALTRYLHEFVDLTGTRDRLRRPQEWSPSPPRPRGPSRKPPT